MTPASVDSPVEFVVYSRRGCHLCELLLEQLEPLVGRRGKVSVRNVDEFPEWLTEYGERIPVVCCRGQELCHYHLDRRAVLAALDSAPA